MTLQGRLQRRRILTQQQHQLAVPGDRRLQLGKIRALALPAGDQQDIAPRAHALAGRLW